MTSDLKPLRPGDPAHLGVHRLLGRLGEGAQGVVFLGEAPGAARVAVKLLHPDLVGDADARARFLREVAAAKRVARFCTAQVLVADAEGDRPYIVSEYVHGPSLHRLVATEGPRSEAALERLAIGTVSALAGIHKAGVVHRDFKPHNVLIGPDGPRVIDFGVARALDASATMATSSTVGTPAYMAPEQLAGDQVGPPADIFAWGITMVYAATGRPAFGNDTIPAVMHRILHDQPDLAPLPRPLRDLVAASLSKDPARRPTAQRILLTLVGEEDPPAADTTRTFARRRPRRLLSVAAAAVLVIGVLAALPFLTRDDGPAHAAPQPSASRIRPVPHTRRPGPVVSSHRPQPKSTHTVTGSRACRAVRRVDGGKANGQFCALRSAGVPVYAHRDRSSPVVGRLTQGGTANWFVGQAGGPGHTHWAYTLSDGARGAWGWVPVAYFAGAGNGAADATLTACGVRCHPY